MLYSQQPSGAIPGSITLMLFLTWKKLLTLNLSRLVGSCERREHSEVQPGCAKHLKQHGLKACREEATAELYEDWSVKP